MTLANSTSGRSRDLDLAVENFSDATRTVSYAVAGIMAVAAIVAKISLAPGVQEGVLDVNVVVA